MVFGQELKAPHPNNSRCLDCPIQSSLKFLIKHLLSASRRSKCPNFPLMDPKEVELIQRALRPESIFLEFGSGQSTLYFGPYVKSLISIEHAPDFFKKLSSKLDKLQLNHVHLRLHPAEPGWDNNVSVRDSDYRGTPISAFRGYLDSVDKLSAEQLIGCPSSPTVDVALIDGRCRVACAVKILPYLTESAAVFIHDFFHRDRYKKVLAFYDQVDSVETTTQTIVKLCPKPLALQPFPQFLKKSCSAAQIAKALGPLS